MIQISLARASKENEDVIILCCLGLLNFHLRITVFLIYLICTRVN